MLDVSDVIVDSMKHENYIALYVRIHRLTSNIHYCHTTKGYNTPSRSALNHFLILANVTAVPVLLQRHLHSILVYLALVQYSNLLLQSNAVDCSNSSNLLTFLCQSQYDCLIRYHCC